MAAIPLLASKTQAVESQRQAQTDGPDIFKTSVRTLLDSPGVQLTCDDGKCLADLQAVVRPECPFASQFFTSGQWFGFPGNKAAVSATDNHEPCLLGCGILVLSFELEVQEAHIAWRAW